MINNKEFYVTCNKFNNNKMYYIYLFNDSLYYSVANVQIFVKLFIVLYRIQ